MAKKPKKHHVTPWRSIMISCLIAIPLLVVGFFVKLRYVDRYNAAVQQAEIVSIRELIIRAVEGLKSDAPIDPKTGDIYFPQARLYLPATDDTFQFVYSYESAAGSGHKQLNISRKNILNAKISSLYSVQNLEQLFDKIPVLQSCQRGISVVFDNSDIDSFGGTELRQTLQLNNGKKAYMYLEKGCPDLNDALERLKGIQSY